MDVLVLIVLAVPVLLAIIIVFLVLEMIQDHRMEKKREEGVKRLEEALREAHPARKVRPPVRCRGEYGYLRRRSGR